MGPRLGPDRFVARLRPLIRRWSASEGARPWNARLEAGRAYTSGKDRDRVAAAIDAPVWHAPTEQGPLSPVLTLHAVVTELRLPKVSALAWGGGEANVLDYPDGPATATYVGWSDRGGTGPPVTSPRGGLTDK